jgi:hypothetical protein
LKTRLILLPLPLSVILRPSLAVILSDSEGSQGTAVRASSAKNLASCETSPLHNDQSTLKSRHPGFTESISAIFFVLNHPLICFSLAIAAPTSWLTSKYTSRVMLYLVVNPGTSFSCVHTPGALNHL